MTRLIYYALQLLWIILTNVAAIIYAGSLFIREGIFNPVLIAGLYVFIACLMIAGIHRLGNRMLATDDSTASTIKLFEMKVIVYLYFGTM